MNNDRTVFYSGEATVTDTCFELNGSGKLETFGYLGKYDEFTGAFENNMRHGQAYLVKKDAQGKVFEQYEGNFTADMADGEGKLTVIKHIKGDKDASVKDGLIGKQLNRIESRVFKGQFKNGLMDGEGELSCENLVTY